MVGEPGITVGIADGIWVDGTIVGITVGKLGDIIGTTEGLEVGITEVVTEGDEEPV